MTAPDPDDVLCVPVDVTPEEIQAYLETGAVPVGGRVVPWPEWTAEGRLADCDCQLIQCVCAEARQHVVGCFYRKSITCAVGIACDAHGDDTCSACYPCTCRQSALEPEREGLWARVKGWLQGAHWKKR